MLFTLVSFIILLLILIFVHEFGHFIAAKLLGVRVEKFSLGFPPKAWSKKIGETEYQLAWLPLGGYVSLYGETPGTEVPPELQERSFSHKPVWVRTVVVAAGPLFNVFFAIVALWLVNFVGGAQHVAPIVGPIDPDGPAFRAGLMAEDRVLAIDRTPIEYYDDVLAQADLSQGRPLTLTVVRKGQTLEATVVPEPKEWTDPLGDVNHTWSLGFKALTRPIIDETVPDKPAALAGLKPGDLILSIDETPILDWSDLLAVLKKSDVVETQGDKTVHQKPKPMRIQVDRGGVVLTLTVTPVLEPIYEPNGQTGFAPFLGLKPRLEIIRRPLGFFGSFKEGLGETWLVSKLTVQTFIRLFQTKISLKVLGGPIMIAEVAGKKAREGLIDFIWVMALISVNLAIINLVPLPILDGGQIVFFLLEGLFRRPLSLKVREVCQWVGVTALAALMVLVFYNDIYRWVTRLTGPDVSQIETTTK
ncbi:MAG: RIP metalloprotease RseP [Deltaproteobacteria bacterium]|jgi:regulator of sigma E protease|nr:RIP metalloprotease RseP [Deltaproteobacteria bacterium]